MTFIEVLEQARNLLRSKGRISYGALKRQFALDDEYLEDLKVELIEAEQVAIDENGRVLAWAGDGETRAAPTKNASPPYSLASYTPPHLAPSFLGDHMTTTWSPQYNVNRASCIVDGAPKI